MATFAALLTAVQAISVSGVTRHYDEPPASLNTADLPAAFPVMFAGGIGEKVVSCWDLNEFRSINFAVAIEPSGQGTQAQNYARLAAIMDSLVAAFKALERSQNGTLSTFVEYDLEAAIINVGGQDYWGIMAALRVRDL